MHLQRTICSALVAVTVLLGACAGPVPTRTPTPSPTPTPTPPFGLPLLQLPADEAPHDFGVEWWYFNVHLTGDGGQRYALHDVLFQIQEVETNRTLYVRQVGLANVATDTYASSERIRAVPEPLASQPDGFFVAFGDMLTSGEAGRQYRLAGQAGGTSYDLTLQTQGQPLIHDDDGLVDFGDIGVTYYYSRPRLTASGSVTEPDGSIVPVRGLGWMDRQWGTFQPVAIGWDWASIQLHDGTDLMVTRVFDEVGSTRVAYGTLRRPGGLILRLDADEFELEPIGGMWASPRTGFPYPTMWRVAVPGAGLELTLEPLVEASEFVSSALGLAYWESGADVRGPDGALIGQGFVELAWPRGITP